MPLTRWAWTHVLIAPWLLLSVTKRTGRYSIDDAKMTGMTPAWFTLIGNVGGRAAVLPASDHAFGVLHRDATLRLFHEHDEGDDREPDSEHDQERPAPRAW